MKRHKHRFLVLTCGWLAIALFSPLGAWAEETVVSLSTFIHLADAQDHYLQPRGFAYLPAGTRVLEFDHTVTYHGAQHHLILTEAGLWGYIREGQFLDTAQLDELRAKSNKWFFVTREHILPITLKKGVELRLRMTRSERYPVVAEREKGVEVLVTADKLPIPFLDNLTALIPRRLGRVVDLSRSLAREEVADFRRSRVDGVFGVSKPCGTQRVVTTRVRATGAVSTTLDTFFRWLAGHASIDAEVEVRQLETFPANLSVRRRYYAHRGERGLYRLTEVQGCDGGQSVTSTYVDPADREITLDASWAHSSSLPVDRHTGRPLVTCPQQYFRLHDAIAERGFTEEEIPFLISRAARFRKINGGECSTEENSQLVRAVPEFPILPSRAATWRTSESEHAFNVDRMIRHDFSGDPIQVRLLLARLKEAFAQRDATPIVGDVRLPINLFDGERWVDATTRRQLLAVFPHAAIPEMQRRVLGARYEDLGSARYLEPDPEAPMVGGINVWGMYLGETGVGLLFVDGRPRIIRIDTPKGYNRPKKGEQLLPSCTKAEVQDFFSLVRRPESAAIAKHLWYGDDPNEWRIKFLDDGSSDVVLSTDPYAPFSPYRLYRADVNNDGIDEYVLFWLCDGSMCSQGIAGVYQKIGDRLVVLPFDDIVVRNLFPGGDPSDFCCFVSRTAPALFRKGGKVYISFGNGDKHPFVYLWERQTFSKVKDND